MRRVITNACILMVLEAIKTIKLKDVEYFRNALLEMGRGIFSTLVLLFLFFGFGFSL